MINSMPIDPALYNPQLNPLNHQSNNQFPTVTESSLPIVAGEPVHH